MKKLLLTFGAFCGISAGAFAQGSMFIENNLAPEMGGINTVTTNASDAIVADYYTGSMILEIYAVQNASLSVLQADQSGLLRDSMNLPAALSLLASDGYAQQTINGSESITLSVNVGFFDVGSYDIIGNSSTLTTSSTVNTDYVILGLTSDGMEGLLALNPSMSGAPAPGTPIDVSRIWPGSATQAFNLYLVPEPTTFALAGLGGLSMLFLRRRKA